MSSHATLSAATQDRKARLAQLKSLKRKAPDQSNDSPNDQDEASSTLPAATEDLHIQQHSTSTPDPATSNAASTPKPTDKYLSGRNYDPAARGPKLGFETQPSSGINTVEAQAAAISSSIAEQQLAEVAAQDQPLDLFKLQPKKPNWDLKRDLARKLEVLDVRTDNAIARVVRARIEAARQREGGGEDALGMEGATLVEATREMEREQEAERAAEEE
ncbi:hypothetical protein FH972_025881 [Carpinus fangiana]|uniref:Cwf18 pre-mRNA splicing factor n=1 Tax=Carpinus fangiana TaxID=176857 RepID=A0A5N6L4W0_9ROSI|nr:hypothetical protein FH972_025881 [Carpinus fangiana]